LERKNLWAPWRAEYIQGLSKAGDCFICHYLNEPQNDDSNFVLWRSGRSIVVLNRFPYNNGHLLIAPVRHIGELEETDEAELLELTKLMRETKRLLSIAIKPHGFNIGMNFGRCAGAGLPEHLHIHIVPRWDGDTNFMSTCSDTRVISQSLDELYRLLKEISQEHKLPRL
jgi:ATP adenylyltransferase